MGAIGKILLLLALVGGMVAVACGDGGEPAPVAQTVQESVGQEPEVLEAATAPAVVEAEPEPTVAAPTPSPVVSQVVIEPTPEPPSGGVLRRLWDDPPTLDPALTSDTTSAFLVVELFSGLVAINADLELIPDIAERWEISGDGLVYTFYLRRDVKFHDGKPVTAQDFKWSIERALNPETASPVGDTYLGDIVGAEDLIEGRTAELLGLTVIDDYTLQFTIDAPKAYFLAKLTYPTAYVLDRENVESGGGNWADQPNGTGPFKLKEYRVGERIVLERNEHFYRGLANPDTIIMNLAGGQSMAMYENDEIDITGISLLDLERVRDPNNLMNRELVVAAPEFNVTYIGFNTTMPPFDDPKFRQALNHAVDKELIANEVFSSVLVPAYGILPPGLPGYNPDLEGLRFDRDLAQRLLAESDYADPDTRPRIVVTVPGTGGGMGLDLEIILVMWRDFLGVEVQIQQVEWATYLQELNRGVLQAYAGLGWEADYPDPQDFLDILFHTDSSINHGDYSNPEADGLLEQARVEQDPVRRIKLYHQAEELIVNDAAWVPLWFQTERYVLIKPHVKDYRMTPMILPKLKHVRIEG